MAKLSPSLIRGDYEVLQFVIQEPDPAGTPTEETPYPKRVRDITSDSFIFTAKLQPDGIPFITKTSAADGGVTKTTPLSGEGEIEILGDDTDGLTEKTTLYCDLEGTSPGPRKYTTRFELVVDMDITV